MATGFNTQTGNGEYRLQFETDNEEYFLLMQELARCCVDHPPTRTNADRIRAMSDRELAAFLAGKFTDHETMKAVQKGEMLTATYISQMANTWFGVWMQWLRQPAEVTDGG